MNSANPNEFWTNQLPRRAEIFPHQLNLVADKVLLAELSQAEVTAASFLDQRIFKQSTKAHWVPWQVVADIFDEIPRPDPPGFIFHVGHCGSTLLSRLLEYADGTRGLREPLPLRTLAQDEADARDGRSFLSEQARLNHLQVLLKMYCRGSTHTVIKATSICTGLLPLINAVEPATRSVFIYNRPETHIATLLAGQNALMDLRGFAQLRLQRLQQASGLDIQLNQLSTAQLAALSWLSEATSANQSLETYPDQLAVLEFESLLKHPMVTLEQLFLHLGIPASREVLEKAVSGPVLQTYSKAPEHQYNAATRTAILADSRARFRLEIRQAMDWLESLSVTSGLVLATLKRFG